MGPHPCFPATGAEQITEAWRLVYHTYRRHGLIDVNRHAIHCSPAAASESSMVGLAKDPTTGRIIATLTAIADSPRGLPLDALFPEQLGQLRAEHGPLTELGLLATCERCSATLASQQRGADMISTLIDLMRLAQSFAATHAGDHLIAAVHPHHAGFYCKAFGFRRVSPTRYYPLVNDHPAVLLHSNLAEARMRVWRHDVRNLVQQPLPASHFKQRFSFAPDDMLTTPLQAYLDDRALSIRQAG